MNVEIVSFSEIDINSSTLNPFAKTLIICATKKEFRNIQRLLLLSGNANRAIPILYSNCELEQFEDFLVASKLCRKSENGLEISIKQQAFASPEISSQGGMQINEVDEISILVRQWDSFEMTSQCLDSLLATDYSKKRILLIDDASKDWSYLHLFFAYPSIHVVRTIDRLEYCNSFNLLAKYATHLGSDFIFIVNNDTSNFSQNIFKELIGNSNAQIGVISSRVKDYSGNIIVKEDRKWLGIPFNIATEGYLIALNTWNKIGGFNSSLIRYTEDLEIVRELRNLGLEQKRVDTVYFSHLGNGSSSRQNFIPIFFAARNLIWIQKIYFPSGSIFSMLKRSAEKTWPGIFKTNTLTGKRSIFRRFIYLILGLISGAFSSCPPRDPHADPYEKLFKPPMKFTDKLL
jgi:GT2 family glycosyltransferase